MINSYYDCSLNIDRHVSSLKRPFLTSTGIGGVGSAFLSQLAALQKRYPQIAVVLISRSNQTLSTLSFSEPLSLETWSAQLSASKQPGLTPSEIHNYLITSNTTRAKCILVDNTSNQTLAEAYPSFLSDGISIVTPNKKAFSSSLALWQEIESSSFPADPHGGFVYHESTVGAGLPVISTLKDLVATGDQVRRIEGVFSGTLSFLFNNFAPAHDASKGGKWSEEVRKAKELGYTEPDPRDDLNGLDVARKLVILARLAGLKIKDTSAFPVESLIPKELESCGSGAEFTEKLSGYDGEMAALREAAHQQGKVVRYMGSVDIVKGELKVGLQKLEQGHPVLGLLGSDNIVGFYTERYGDRPLIVQGAG